MEKKWELTDREEKKLDYHITSINFQSIKIHFCNLKKKSHSSLMLITKHLLTESPIKERILIHFAAKLYFDIALSCFTLTEDFLISSH